MFESRAAPAAGEQPRASAPGPPTGLLGAIVLLSLSILACGGPTEERPAKSRLAASEPPELIYILTIDALRADLIGRSHNGQVVLPELSTFASESVRFDHAYSQAPFTKISVASLFTGLWPQRLGVKNCRLKIFPGGVELCRGLDTRFHTIAEELGARGYQTLTSLFTTHVRKGDGLLQGFAVQEDELPELPESGNTFVYHHVLGLHAPYQPSAEALEALGVAPSAEPDPAATDWYWTPLTAAQGTALYEHYLAEGRDWDRWFGELKQELERRDAWDDSLIIVTADHGEEFLEHGNTQHSVHLYDESLRVPLLIKFPARSPLARAHGSSFDHRVRLVDIFPTLLHVLDREAPEGFDGDSLIPILEGDETEPDRRPVLAFTSVPRDYEGRSTNFESWMLVSEQFKAIAGYRAEASQLEGAFQHRRGDPIRELYDLREDPDELRNLAAERADLFAALEQQHLELSTVPLPSSGRGFSQVLTLESEEARRQREEQLKSLGYLQ